MNNVTLYLDYNAYSWDVSERYIASIFTERKPGMKPVEAGGNIIVIFNYDPSLNSEDKT